MKYSNCIRFLALFGTLLLSSICYSDTVSGLVVSVADGDTVTVLDSSNTQFKIRLMGIDAPEKKMPYGQKSKEHLSGLIFNKQVAVEYTKQDKYGRTVGKIIVNGLDANMAQVKAGYAWHYKKYQGEQSSEDRLAYAQAEERAHEAKIGLWADIAPTAPWDWRREQKQGRPR